MGILQIIDNFYEELPQDSFRKIPVVGQLCWLPVVHLNRIPNILDVERADPKEHYITKFQIRQMNRDHFGKVRLPLKALGLREAEELVIHRAKKRPAIIISGGATIFDDITTLLLILRREHLQESSIIVAPLYSVESDSHAGGFPEKMAVRIRGLLYNQFFFCPKGPPLPSDSIVRLDRLQTIIPSPIVLEPMPYRLSEDALGVLMSMVRLLFGSADEANFQALKQLAIEALPPEALRQ